MSHIVRTSVIALCISSWAVAGPSNDYNPALVNPDNGVVSNTEATTTYTNRATFVGAASGPLITEGFEDEALGGLFLPATMNGSNLVVARPVGATSVYISNPNGFGFENTTPAGNQLLGFGDSPGGVDQLGVQTAEFRLGGPANAFGFDLSGYQGLDNPVGSFSVALLSNGSTVESFVSPDTTNFAAHFRGYISDNTFDTVQLTFSVLGGNVADYVAFDEVSFNLVPEPSAAALTVAGIAVWARRRRA